MGPGCEETSTSLALASERTAGYGRVASRRDDDKLRSASPTSVHDRWFMETFAATATEWVGPIWN